MTKHQQILEHVRAEVRDAGKVTPRALRLYVENRISRERYDRAVAAGMVDHKAAVAARGAR